MYENYKDTEAEYKVPEYMLKVRKVQCDLVKQIDIVARKYNLRYYMIYGTLLGAVRHQGYIPWDDDIDLAMPRVDYERLISIADKEFKHPYFLQTPENDKENFCCCCRLRSSETTGLELMNIWHKCNNGIFIDIHVIDGFYEDEKKQKRLIYNIKFYQRMLASYVYFKEFKRIWDLSSVQTKFYYYLSKCYGHRRLCRAYSKACAGKNRMFTKYVGIYTHYTGVYEYLPFYREDFEQIQWLSFEGMKLPAPKGYKRVLSMSMGADYMKLPPEEERKPHHNCFFSTETSYLRLLSRFHDTFKNIEGKEIILFGAGLMFEDYMRRYGKLYKPVFIVDNNQDKWGMVKSGIQIKPPSSILEIPEEKRRVIICNIYYEQIGEQLEAMMIQEYYIYIQNKLWIVNDFLKKIKQLS